MKPAPPTFTGSGNTLSGRRPLSQPQPPSSKGKEKEAEPANNQWGSSGHTLGGRNTQPHPSFRSRELGAGGAPVPRLPSRKSGQKQQQKSPSPDFGVDDDDDVIVVDSD
jgi:ubiquitin fusion degradation protein 1